MHDLDEHLSCYRCTWPARPQAIVRPVGTLLFMGCIDGAKAASGAAFVIAATAAMSDIRRSLAHELAPVRVNLIAAGFVDTPMSAEVLGDELDARRDELRTTLPIGRVVDPVDIAALAVHVMTNTAVTVRRTTSTAANSCSRGGCELPGLPTARAGRSLGRWPCPPMSRSYSVGVNRARRAGRACRERARRCEPGAGAAGRGRGRQERVVGVPAAARVRVRDCSGGGSRVRDGVSRSRRCISSARRS